MSNDHDYGEPWRAGDFGHILTKEGAETELVAACNMWEPKYRNRILECVNTMAGLDPAKVRQLISEISGCECACAAYPEGSTCLGCRARACFYEEDEK